MSVDSMLPVWVAAIAATYVVLSVRLRAGAQPLRLQLAEEGEALLRSGQLNERGEKFVNFMLNNAFGFRLKLLVMFVAAPFVIVNVVLLNRETDISPKFGIANIDTMRAFDRIRRLHVAITVANHPLTCVVLALWLMSWISICFIFSSIVGPIRVFDGTALAYATANQAAAFSSRMRGRHADAC